MPPAGGYDPSQRTPRAADPRVGDAATKPPPRPRSTLLKGKAAAIVMLPPAPEAPEADVSLPPAPGDPVSPEYDLDDAEVAAVMRRPKKVSFGAAAQSDDANLRDVETPPAPVELSEMRCRFHPPPPHRPPRRRPCCSLVA